MPDGCFRSRTGRPIMASMTTETASLLDPAAARLDGKVAIVTGANGASGAPVVHALAALGANLVLAHRGNDRAPVDALRGALEGAGRSVLDITADTSRADGPAGLFDAAIDSFGAVDIVVHLPGASINKPIAELTDEEWRAGVAANLDSAFFVLREAARRIADNGRIVLLSTSLTAVTTPGYANYRPMKAAVEQLVRTAAKELGGRGITVNAVAPGPLESPFVNDALPAAAVSALRGFSPMGRMGEWEEIAPVIAFLATAQARWISAQTIRVNGAMAA
jgi:3-oxoacyl-[acyl-carrier protein] reductase